jgi:methyltransferase (TIGR00027 family)
MGASDSFAAVSKTALGVARVRAHETGRTDHLFSDPFAMLFLDAFARANPDAPMVSITPPSLRVSLDFQIVIRTRFFDEYLLAAGAAGCRQVVVLAAGLDARAMRLHWPDGVRLFEVELPPVLSFKDAVLAEHGAAPRCQRVSVPADLRADWPSQLLTAGFEPALPTAWLAEGLLIYLAASDAAHLLTAIGELSAPGSQIGLERGNTHGALMARARATSETNALSPLWKGGLGEDTADWLNRHGWRSEIHDLTTLAASYGRPTWRTSSSGLVTATRLQVTGNRRSPL